MDTITPSPSAHSSRSLSLSLDHFSFPFTDRTRSDIGNDTEIVTTSNTTSTYHPRALSLDAGCPNAHIRSSRRLSRKLPPAITESLLELDLENIKYNAALPSPQVQYSVYPGKSTKSGESPKSPLETIELTPDPSSIRMSTGLLNVNLHAAQVVPYENNSGDVDLDLDTFLRRGSNDTVISSSASSSSDTAYSPTSITKPQHTLVVSAPSDAFGASHYAYTPPKIINNSFSAGSVARKRPTTTEGDADLRVKAISRAPSLHVLSSRPSPSPSSSQSPDHSRSFSAKSSSLKRNSFILSKKGGSSSLSKLTISSPIACTPPLAVASLNSRPTSSSTTSSSNTGSTSRHYVSAGSALPSLSSQHQSLLSLVPNVPLLSAPSATSSISSAGPCTTSACSVINVGLGGYRGTSGSAHLGRSGVKESRKERKARKDWEDEHFEVDALPSLKDMYAASEIEVKDEHGQRWKFGDLIRERRTIVVFIRHWYCPLCAQYMNSIVSNVTVDALERAGVDLIIIGNGSWRMLEGYKTKAFKCPFPMYTDSSLSLYRALGLTRQTGSGGPDDLAGSYLSQTTLESTLQTIKRATQMPLLHNPGHMTQIGGEFIFDGPLHPIFTHRMSSTRDHMAIEDVCLAAGMTLAWRHFEPGPRPPPVHRVSDLDEADLVEGGWRRERDSVREEIKRKKEARRSGGSAASVDGGGDDAGEVVVILDGHVEEDVQRMELSMRGMVLA